MNNLLAPAEKVAIMLKARRETVAVSESSAGGLISAALLAMPGASVYFLGGAVVYTYAARGVFLDVPDAALVGLRPATEPYVLLLARAAPQRYVGSGRVGRDRPDGQPIWGSGRTRLLRGRRAGRARDHAGNGHGRSADQHAGIRGRRARSPGTELGALTYGLPDFAGHDSGASPTGESYPEPWLGERESNPLLNPDEP
jgi:hypothetical protein